MSRKFAIEERLSDRDFTLFNAYLFERHTTLKTAKDWLEKRGYKICRTSVHKYRQALVKGRAWASLASKNGLGRATFTRQLNAHAATLDVYTLAMLARYADFLAYDRRQTKPRSRVNSRRV